MNWDIFRFKKHDQDFYLMFFLNDMKPAPIAISTNLSLLKWIQVFGSIEMTNALIDRFTHRCNIHIFEGESFRFIESKRRLEKK